MDDTPQDQLIGQAIALHRSGQWAEAGERLRESLAFHPGHPLLLAHLGTLCLQQGDPAEGLRLLEEALRVDPSQFMALSSCSLALAALGRFQDSLEAYDRMIGLKPQLAWVHNNRGAVLQELRQPQEALAAFDHAIALDPRYASAHNNRGVLLEKLGRPQEGLESFDRAITLDPRDVEAHYQRGNTLLGLGRPREAVESFDRAIALEPGGARAYINRANARKELHLLPEALKDLDRAIALSPGQAQAYFNKSLLKILAGDYEEGFRLYEWRWELAPQGALHPFTQPLWTGEGPLEGKTLLIHAEQGLGDALQFCRYAPMAAQRGVKVIVEVPGRLVSVVSTLSGNLTMVEKGRPLPPFDLHCPMLSLPLAFKTKRDTVPSETPYLFPDPGKRDLWRKRLGPKARPRIALAWAGKKDNSKDSARSMALETLGPLLGLPFEFHSLQLEYGEKDLALLADLPQVRDHRKEQEDFSDTAAMMAEMDLVLSVDTSVAHLAGALGRPVWLMLSYTPDHRWMLDRTDSPWYPTAVLFRQPERGDWKSVVLDVIGRLREKFLDPKNL